MSKLKIYIPEYVYSAFMEFSQAEDPGRLAVHSLLGLFKHGLIDSDYRFGTKTEMSLEIFDADDAGLIASPTLLGAELFLWANGLHGSAGYDIFTAEIATAIIEKKIIKGAKLR